MICDGKLVHKSISKSLHLSHWLWFILWGIIAFVFLYFTPNINKPEVKNFLSIANEMMLTHHYLTPTWHGKIYTENSPLFFWSIIAGWKLFGISKWWPEFITILLLTFSLLLSKTLAKQLWPQKPVIANITPYIMMGCFYWVWFSKQIHADVFFVFAILLGLSSLIKTLNRHHSAWIWFSMAIALGAFVKGPVVLAFILLPAIFLPLWFDKEHTLFPKWYGFLGGATMLGLLIPLLWAIAVSNSSNVPLQTNMFYHQARHLSHQTSTLTSLLHLPLLALPWTLYLPFWRGISSLRFSSDQPGDAVCFTVIASTLIVLSIFSHRLSHYLFPLFPILALLVTRVILHDTPTKKRIVQILLLSSGTILTALLLNCDNLHFCL